MCIEKAEGFLKDAALQHPWFVETMTKKCFSTSTWAKCGQLKLCANFKEHAEHASSVASEAATRNKLVVLLPFAQTLTEKKAEVKEAFNKKGVSEIATAKKCAVAAEYMTFLDQAILDHHEVSEECLRQTLLSETSLVASFVRDLYALALEEYAQKVNVAHDMAIGQDLGLATVYANDDIDCEAALAIGNSGAARDFKAAWTLVAGYTLVPTMFKEKFTSDEAVAMLDDVDKQKDEENIGGKYQTCANKVGEMIATRACARKPTKANEMNGELKKKAREQIQSLGAELPVKLGLWLSVD